MNTDTNNSTDQLSSIAPFVQHPGAHTSIIYPVNVVASQAPLHSRRRQVKNACTNCQRVCKKCDDARPCQRCVKYNIREGCINSGRKERQKGIKRGPYKKRTGKGSSEEATTVNEPHSSSESTMITADLPVPDTIISMLPTVYHSGFHPSHTLPHPPSFSYPLSAGSTGPATGLYFTPFYVPIPGHMPPTALGLHNNVHTIFPSYYQAAFFPWSMLQHSDGTTDTDLHGSSTESITEVE